MDTSATECNTKTDAGPERTCIGCAKTKTKWKLIRLALNREDKVVWDLRQVMPGRGAYICPNDECLIAALKRRRFNRAFRRTVATDLIEKAERPWKNQQAGE